MISHEVWACAETADARSVAKLMADHDIGSIPVLDPNGRLEGIVTDRDLCIKVIAQGYSFETPIREFMSSPAHFVHPEATVQEIESLMRRYKVRRLPVVDDKQRLQGFISLSDLARHCESYEDEHDLVEVIETVSTPRYE